jgi:hypothetical protein
MENMPARDVKNVDHNPLVSKGKFQLYLKVIRTWWGDLKDCTLEGHLRYFHETFFGANCTVACKVEKKHPYDMLDWKTLPSKATNNCWETCITCLIHRPHGILPLLFSEWVALNSWCVYFCCLFGSNLCSEFETRMCPFSPLILRKYPGKW